MKTNRRNFLKRGLSFAALASLSPSDLLAMQSVNFQTSDRLSYLAYQSVSRLGEWSVQEIEGEIPKEINGQFLKIGPGKKENFGESLQHFFDGDALLANFQFTQGELSCETSFIDTPEFKQEQYVQKALYDEFGTAIAGRPYGRKNNPNINMLEWNGELLCFSEGGVPARYSLKKKQFLGYANFDGSLPDNVGLAAHYKVDLKTGDVYLFGIEQGVSMALKVYRLAKSTNKLTELYSIDQNKVYMIHDMIQTENYLIFVVPPVSFSFIDLMSGQRPIAKTLRFNKRARTKIYVLDKNGKKEVKRFQTNSLLAFHHANAYEKNGEIYFHSFVADDASLLDLIANWQQDYSKPVQTPRLEEFRLIPHPRRPKVERKILLANHDFPVFNLEYSGKRNQFIYATGMGDLSDPMGMNRISKFDIKRNTAIIYQLDQGQACGECCLIHPGWGDEDAGYLGLLCYDQNRDESFIDIIVAKDMTRAARCWLGQRVPLGFHGKFLSSL